MQERTGLVNFSNTTWTGQEKNATLWSAQREREREQVGLQARDTPHLEVSGIREVLDNHVGGEHSDPAAVEIKGHVLDVQDGGHMPQRRADAARQVDVRSIQSAQHAVSGSKANAVDPPPRTGIVESTRTDTKPGYVVQQIKKSQQILHPRGGVFFFPHL